MSGAETSRGQWIEDKATIQPQQAGRAHCPITMLLWFAFASPLIPAPCKDFSGPQQKGIRGLWARQCCIRGQPVWGSKVRCSTGAQPRKYWWHCAWDTYLGKCSFSCDWGCWARLWSLALLIWLKSIAFALTSFPEQRAAWWYQKAAEACWLLTTSSCQLLTTCSCVSSSTDRVPAPVPVQLDRFQYLAQVLSQTVPWTCTRPQPMAAGSLQARATAFIALLAGKCTGRGWPKSRGNLRSICLSNGGRVAFKCILRAPPGILSSPPLCLLHSPDSPLILIPWHRSQLTAWNWNWLWKHSLWWQSTKPRSANTQVHKSENQAYF